MLRFTLLVRPFAALERWLFPFVQIIDHCGANAYGKDTNQNGLPRRSKDVDLKDGPFCAAFCVAGYFGVSSGQYNSGNGGLALYSYDVASGESRYASKWPADVRV
eukprot:COSAG06_NODE_2631_length_6549_cov_4.290078_6_plen_105_part_00